MVEVVAGKAEGKFVAFEFNATNGDDDVWWKGLEAFDGGGYWWWWVYHISLDGKRWSKLRFTSCSCGGSDTSIIILLLKLNRY